MNRVSLSPPQASLSLSLSLVLISWLVHPVCPPGLMDIKSVPGGQGLLCVCANEPSCFNSRAVHTESGVCEEVAAGGLRWGGKEMTSL